MPAGNLSRAAPNKDCHLVCTAGRDAETNELVVAFLEKSEQPKAKSKINVRSEMVLAVPENHAWSADPSRLVMLPYLALTVLGPLSLKNMELSSIQGKTAVILGGASSPVVLFCFQILKSLGGQTISVSLNPKEQVLKSWGVFESLDARVESFTEKLGRFDLVFDALGDESDKSKLIESLQRDCGATYLSVAPAELLARVNDGLASAAKSVLGRLFNGGKDADQAEQDKIVVAKPTIKACQVVSRAVELTSEVDAGINMSSFPIQYATMDSIMECISWPRDAESGERFGFSAPSIWIGDSDDSDSETAKRAKQIRNKKFGNAMPKEMRDQFLGYQRSDSESESESESAVDGGVVNPEMIAQAAAGAILDGDSPVVAVPIRGQVQNVTTVPELRSVISSGDPTETYVLFVSASWCRRCKYLNKQYEKIAESAAEQNIRVSFLKLDCADDADAAAELDVFDVPEFLMFRNNQQLECIISTATFDTFRDSVFKYAVASN